MNLSEVTSLTEDEARKYLESIRWPKGAICPHCGSTECVKLEGKATRPGVYKCKAAACRKQFTVTVKTVMERSHISIRHWAMTFHLLCASKKGMSAHQLHRALGITYKSAWFLCHRVRHAMSQGAFGEKLSGTVECDETYVGGKKSGSFGRTVGQKKAVMVLVQRDGSARALPIERVTAAALKGAIRVYVSHDSKIVTDDFPSYRGIGKEFAGGHSTVKHSAKEYVNRAGEHTNTAESFFALLKRGHYGTFHQISKKHLHRYADEFSFRWNHRKVSDGERCDAAVRGAEGKRLTYR